MSESKGLVKHVLLAKFKEDITPERQDQLIKGYAALVPLIQPMKAFSWGRNVSIENLDQGFTHVFESYFDSVEGIAEYVAHPVHVEFASEFLGALEKVLIVDYTPTNVSLP